LKGALEVDILSLWEFCEGNRREGSLAADPEGDIEKALEIGISFHGGSCMSEGNLELGGLYTGDFE
jgi:hypothetical protein